MSKAEKFIQDCTRGCSNLVYKDTINGKEFNTYNEWLTPDQARRAVENAKEETLKNCEHNIKVLEVKARLAANIFNTLSVHLKMDALSSYTLEKLRSDTINTTNRIFNEIQ